MFGLMPYRRNRNSFSLYNMPDPMSIFDELERDFRGSENGIRVDISDKGDKYLLEADMPGFRKEDIRVEIENGYLTICGERNNTSEEKDDDGNIFRRERVFGSFRRSFGIGDVKEDSIKAEYKDGVLKLTMEKKDVEKPSPRRLEIE